MWVPDSCTDLLKPDSLSTKRSYRHPTRQGYIYCSVDLYSYYIIIIIIIS